MEFGISDIEYFVINNTLAIRPTQNGRLGHLCQIVFKTPERSKTNEDDFAFTSWVFMDTPTFQDENGNTIIDHHTRGAVVGNIKKGKDFLQMCRNLGFRVVSENFKVPLCNGQRAHGRFDHTDITSDDPHHKVKFLDYLQKELAQVRFDLPTEKDLRAVITDEEIENGQTCCDFDRADAEPTEWKITEAAFYFRIARLLILSCYGSLWYNMKKWAIQNGIMPAGKNPSIQQIFFICEKMLPANQDELLRWIEETEQDAIKEFAIEGVILILEENKKGVLKFR